jgi:tetratricopeptide (TPR) repeat protein
VLATRGGCLANLGRLDEALACCERALAIDDKQWQAHLVIARVLATRDGDRAEIYGRLGRVVTLWKGARAELPTVPELAVLRDEPAFAALLVKQKRG